MAQLQKGLVVHAKAGRDKGKFFVVLDMQEDRVFLVDGVKRKLEKPKVKNARHIALTNHVLPEQALTTNKQIHKALRENGFTAGAEGLPEGGNDLG